MAKKHKPEPTDKHRDKPKGAHAVIETAKILVPAHRITVKLTSKTFVMEKPLYTFAADDPADQAVIDAMQIGDEFPVMLLPK
jgi:hypothetical protein